MNHRIFTSLMLLFFINSVFFTIVASGQENGRESRIFETGRFNRLFLEGAFGVELIQGKKPSVEMHVSDPKAFDYLKVTNKDGMLHLHVDRKPFDFSRITLYITFDELTWLRVFGSIRVATRGYLDLKNLEMVLEGGARVKLQAKAHGISIENKGGVLVELLGVTDVLNMYLAGTGHINAGEMRARDVDFRIDGVGTGKVYATRRLNATIKGAGKISYLGEPKVTESIDGLGSVKPN